jgi:hypothetical protein
MTINPRLEAPAQSPGGQLSLLLDAVSQTICRWAKKYIPHA